MVRDPNTMCTFCILIPNLCNGVLFQLAFKKQYFIWNLIRAYKIFSSYLTPPPPWTSLGHSNLQVAIWFSSQLHDPELVWVTPVHMWLPHVNFPFQLHAFLSQNNPASSICATQNIYITVFTPLIMGTQQTCQGHTFEEHCLPLLAAFNSQSCLS